MKECSICNEVKSVEDFQNYKDNKGIMRKRTYCKQCRNNMRKNYAKEHQVEHKMRQCAENLINRLTSGINNQANKSYKEKGIKSLIGNTSGEVYQYLYDNFYNDFKSLIDKGEIPSIDRIDSNKNYEHGNIRIITFEENSRLGREQSLKVCQKPIRITFSNGNIIDYEGIKAAGEESGISRNILQKILSGKTKQKQEYFVEYII